MMIFRILFLFVWNIFYYGLEKCSFFVWFFFFFFFSCFGLLQTIFFLYMMVSKGEIYVKSSCFSRSFGKRSCS